MARNKTKSQLRGKRSTSLSVTHNFSSMLVKGCKCPDQRLKSRFGELLSRLGSKIGASLPTACQDMDVWVEQEVGSDQSGLSVFQQLSRP
jgi:hypothetical protein